MKRTVKTTYMTGYIFFDEKTFEEVSASGNTLVANIKGNPEDNHSDALREYLEQHARVVGSESIARFRLEFYDEAEALFSHEQVERLEQLLATSSTLVARTQLVQRGFVELMNGT